MNRKLGILVMLFITAGILSCKKDNNRPDSNYINIRTSIDAGTIVKSPELDDNGSGNFIDGDTFNLTISNNNKEISHFPYTVGVSKIKWDDANISNIDGVLCFSACYPDINADNAKFTFDIENSSYPDMLLAYNPDVKAFSEMPIELSFKHAMHRINITYKTDDDNIDLTEINTICTAKSQCEINLVGEPSVSALDKKTDFSKKGEKISFIVAPQDASDVIFKISCGNINKTFNISESNPEITELESGMQLNLTLTIKNGNIEIGKAVIQGWGNQGNIEGDIII